MILLEKTDSSSSDFRQLIKALDAGLLDNYKEAQSWYDQFNSLENIKYVIVAYRDDKPVGCGAIKAFDPAAMEVKRMYVEPERRGQGLASRILKELEDWAISLGYKKCVLETGNLQKAAIGLYQNSGYKVIPNYGQYADVETSVCFEKFL